MTNDADLWIVVPNWDKFQHYKDRNPKWIKVYTNLLDNPRFRKLTDKQRGLLFSIWLLYAASGGQVPASPSYLARKLGGITEWEHRQMRKRGESVVSECREAGESVVRGRDLKALEQAKFIALVASLEKREIKKPSISPFRRSPAEEPLETDRSLVDDLVPAAPDPDNLQRLRELRDRIGRPVPDLENS